ncbi:Na+/H+ antiporter subunit E [Tessaracoccus sp. Z1128]
MMMKSPIPWRQRLRFRPLSVFGMAAVWVLMWGSVAPLILISGAALGWVIGVAFPLPPIFWQGRFRPLGFTSLTWHLLADLVVSSLRLVRLAFEKEVNLHAGIVRVDLHTDDDLYQVQVAEILSLVPGTVVVEVVREPRRLYVHALELVDDASLERVQRMTTAVESRVVRSFGSDQEIAAFDRSCLASPLARTPQMEE